MRLPVTPPPPVFGLMAWLENTRIQLPLRAVDCRFRVTGEVAVVELDQVFQQTASESLDVTYTFPLPHGAAVYRCEMHVNGRVIQAHVMEEKEAQRVVEKQKQLGHRTALVQADRENVFRVDLGNLAPGDIVVLRLAYFHTLDRLATQMSLRIPFCPGIRYIPGEPLLRANRGKGSVDDTDQVPDASCISPPRIDRLHPDAASLHLEGALDAADVSLATLSSPTHPVIVRPKDPVLEMRLAETEALPDRDFVVRWEESVVAQAQTRTWSVRDEQATYALMQVRAPREVAAQEGWEQDIYFLVDRSGSMQGKKWEKCAQALMEFVKELGKNDRVWITFFESKFQDFAEAPMNAAALLADKGFQTIAELKPGGGTELLPALRHVLEVRKKHSEGRRSRMVVLTDGQVGNEAAILGAFEGEGKLPVYCFGIDTAVNDAFLKRLVTQQGGRCVLMTPHDDIPAAVHRLAHSLRRPVVTELALCPSWAPANPEAELMDLHEGEVLLVPVRCPTHAEGAPLWIRGRLADGSDWKGEGTILPESDPAPRLLWAQRRIQTLLAARRSAEAVALAVEHNLACVGASFVAWDESEKVPIARREVYQPSLIMEAPMQPAAPMAYCTSKIEKACINPESYHAPAADPQQYKEWLENQRRRALVSVEMEPVLDLKAMKSKYVRESPLAWLGGRKALPARWTAILLQQAERDDAAMRELLSVLAWLFHDWSSLGDAVARRAQVDLFFKTVRRDREGLAQVESFVRANLKETHLRHALELLEAVRNAGVPAP